MAENTTDNTADAYTEKFHARVNKQGGQTEIILNGVKGVHALTLHNPSGAGFINDGAICTVSVTVDDTAPETLEGLRKSDLVARATEQLTQELNSLTADELRSRLENGVAAPRTMPARTAPNQTTTTPNQTTITDTAVIPNAPVKTVKK